MIAAAIATADVVTQPASKLVGRPVVWRFTCDVCKLAFPDGAPVLFALQEGGSGPYPGMSGWYTATVHPEPCGVGFLAEHDDYRQRLCRGCHRPMWLRNKSRRSHCCSRCRQADYRRRYELCSRALAEGHVLYQDELYWNTRPGGHAVIAASRATQPDHPPCLSCGAAFWSCDQKR